jgi:oxaloacetate decarboxylase alpha subunit
MRKNAKEAVKRVGFEDETFRTAPQSLWATRMRTETMLGIAKTVDEAGFDKICVTSGAAFETAVKYLFEDPWERLRLLRRNMPKTPLNFFVRSRNLMGWQMYPNDVVELFLKCIQRVGIEWIEVFDGLNDLDIIEFHFRVGKKLGLRTTCLLSYNESPVHTNEYYVEKVKVLMKLGVDVVNLSDPCGVLLPERLSSLIRAMRPALQGGAQLAFFAHSNTGISLDQYKAAMEVGIDSLKTVTLPLAYGYSLPASIHMLHAAREMGIPVSLDERRIKEMDDYFYWSAYQEKKPIGKAVPFDPVKYKSFAAHQIPGGMMSNLENQLSELGLTHKLPEVLEEAAVVRKDLGYPVMVTPFSQWVGVQAVFNVMEGERYRTVPQELRLYVRGAYGKPAAPIDPNVMDRVLAGGDEEPMNPARGFQEKYLKKVRSEQGPFKSDEEMLLNIFNTRETMEKFYQNKKVIDVQPIVKRPLAALIQELARRQDIKAVRIEKGPLRIQFGDHWPGGVCSFFS